MKRNIKIKIKSMAAVAARTHVLACGVLIVPLLVQAQANLSSPDESKPAPTWTFSLSGSLTNTFQLILGDRFGKGPDFQDQLTVGVNDIFARGDSLSVFGWSTADLPSASPNWQSGLLYKLPLLRRKNHLLVLSGGGQRWVLPMVGSGAKDWMVTGNLTYETALKRVPIFFSEDSYTLLKSTLPTGSATYSHVYTQHALFKYHGFRLALRQGPAYSYSWGFYGINGSRVLRYGGSLVANWRGNGIEAGYSKQFGLQDGVSNNGYWSFSVMRQITKAFF
jgi:hypothetical protein